MAKNPLIEAVSWIDGVDEFGKASWCHEKWEHADNYVEVWRYLTNNEVYELKNKETKFKNYIKPYSLPEDVRGF